MPKQILIPRAGWELRWYQRPLWNAMINEGKNVCEVMHRRGGKDEVLLNALAVKAMRSKHKVETEPVEAGA